MDVTLLHVFRNFLKEGSSMLDRYVII